VPWWNEELTTLHKKALALRPRYQRTTNDADLKQQRRLRYQESNRTRQAKLWEDIKILKGLLYWDSSNPWNSVYRYGAGKTRGALTLSTLKANTNTHTANIQSTLNQLMDYFIPEDMESSDGAYHKTARQLITEPMHTANDIPFTQQEVQAALKKFDSRKAPGDALTSEILLQVSRSFSTLFTEVYNECLHRGHFPQQWKRSIIHPEVKRGKEGLSEVRKYRQISLINTGGKLLEKLLINRINHYLHTNRLPNRNQHGFIPQNSTVEAAMAMKQYVLSHMQQRNYVIMVRLDVQGAFDAARWPSILCNLRALNYPRNLYNLARSYFSERVAILHTNT
jgi:hypothetical protein